MPNDVEIFNTYATKRLREDVDLETRLYLDAVDFGLEKSPSLDYLSLVTGVKIHSVPATWITEESTCEHSMNYYGDETDRNYVIDVRDIVNMRAKDIENIVSTLSPDLAQKILAFEESTKYLKTPALSSAEVIEKGYHKALSMLSKEMQNKVKQKIFDRKKAFQNQKKVQEKTDKKQAKSAQFYELLKQVYEPHDFDEQRNLWIGLFQSIGAHNEKDVPGYVKGGKCRVYAELRRDITVQLKNLCMQHHRYPEAKEYQEKVDKYSDTIRLYIEHSRDQDKTYQRPFGSNGAFETGGLYGPDSRFVKPENDKNEVKNPVEKTVQTSQQNIPAEPAAKQQKPTKNENWVQKEIFSNSDFEY